MDDYSTISHDTDSLPAIPDPNNAPRKYNLAPDEVSSKGQSLQFVQMSPRVMAGPNFGSKENAEMPLRVTPNNLRFESLEPGVLYVMTISIKNATSTAQRVRITPPHSPCFALNYIPAGPLAPGLDLRAEVECQLPEDSEISSFTDTILVAMGPHKIEVPLYACKPGPDIVFNSNLNFGLVVEKIASVKRLAFKNRGVDAGVISITLPETTYFRVIPSSFEIEPGRDQIVQFRVEHDELGPIREIATVNIEGLHEPMTIDLSAQIVVQNVSLVSKNGGGLIDCLDVGYLFFGEVRETEALLINNGPSQLAYTVLFDNEESQSSKEQGEDLAKDRCVIISPSEGVLAPYSQNEVVIRYNPKVPTLSKGFTVSYNKDYREPQIVGAMPIIEIPETGQRVEVNIQGAACLPDFTLSPKMLRFGKCAVYDRRDILVTFTNKSNAKMSLEFGEVAHFKIYPLKCVVQGGQAKTFVASFMPTQMGKFKSLFPLSIEGGIATSEIRVIGETNSPGDKRVLVGGPETLPGDFKKPYHFVDPKEVAAQRYAEKNSSQMLMGTKLPGAIIDTDSTTVDNLYEQSTQFSDVLDAEDVIFSNKKALNRKTYNEYLQKSHTKRLDKQTLRLKQKQILSTGYDRTDPFGKDLGMDRGLEEPDLKIPIFSEPLWLANRNDESDGARRVVFDENRLISKKFPAAPLSQSDIRDCASEVSFSEMKLIISSHKVINFGKVNVNSVNVKNFAICNTLQRCIQVQLTGLDNELAGTKMISQIVPVGLIAGFDIYFSTREVGKYHGAFSWMSNGCNVTKVAITADVVPLELNVDKKTVKMAFMDSNLETSVDEDIVLTNPGNASAEFLWGSSECFSCTPERGLIEKGQSAMVKITWKPKFNCSNEADLGLHVIGGVEQVVRVIGDLHPGKCQFKEKSVNFGPVAVGTDYSYSCQIKNIGAMSTVFVFDDIGENFGIRLDPDRAMIEAGQTVKINISLTPVAKMSYDKISLVAQVRGGKPISLKLNGEAIIPQLSLAETSFDFGHVAVGSEVILPLSITNSGTIPSTATLNLKEHPEFYVCLLKEFDTKMIDKMQRKDIAEIIDYYGNSLQQVKEHNDFEDSHTTRPRIWNLNVKAGSTIFAGLVFKPSHPRKFDFPLPFRVPGVRENKVFARTIDAVGVTSRVKFSLSVVDFGDRVVSREPTSRMSFFQEIQLSNVANDCMYEIREIDDPYAQDNGFLEKSNGDNSEEPVFFISPLKGDLPVGAILPIRVTFMPATNTSYHKRLGIFISGQSDESRPYQTIYCTGSGVFPKLSFNVLDVSLPTVPLKITSRGEFTVRNNGYDGLVLKHRVSPTIPIPLDISYPDGLELGYSVQKLRVVVSFKADVAISFSGKIEFYDDDGEKFPLEISGCADGCIFTNSTFVQSYRDNYGFMGVDDQPVYYLSKSEMLVQKQIESKRKEQQRKQRALERQRANESTAKSDSSVVSEKKVKEPVSPPPPSSNSKAKEGIDLERPLNTFDENSKKEIRCLLKWINKFACKKGFDVDDFPQCIIESEADIVVDCIETLSGKKIPGITSKISAKSSNSQQSSSSGEKKPSLLLQKYKDLVLFLVKSGALLNHINPAYLLERSEFLVAMELDLKRLEGERVTPSTLKEKGDMWIKEWENKCSLAWSDILFQVVKVFVLSRISYNTYKTTPGVVVFDTDDSLEETKKGDKKDKKKQKPKIPLELKPSNVYGQSEGVLLMWSLYHMQHACKLGDAGNEASKKSKVAVKRLIDVEMDFGDWFFMNQIIHSHIPESTHLHQVLHSYTAHDRSRKDESFRFFQAAMESVKMNFDVTPDELTSSPRTMFLMLIHLFLGLPCLLPKSTLEFKGRLGDSIVKIIELKNPSKKKISYRVQLEGDKDFSVDDTFVYLEPESMMDFNVTLLPHFSKQTHGRITFWGIRENGVAGTNMVFKLVSNIVGRKPVEVIKKTLTLYEVDTFNVNFTNPYAKECTFLVQTDAKYSGADLSSFIKPGGKKGKLIKGSSNKMGAITNGDLEKSEDDLEAECIFHEPVWSNDEKFTIPYEGTKPMILNAVPFKLGTYTTQIVLIDPAFGEFCHEVIVEVVLPKPDKIDFQCAQSTGEAVIKVLKFSSKNANFEKAVAFVIESRLPSARRGKARLVLQSLIGSTLTDEDTGACEFKVELMSPYMKADSIIPFVSEYIMSPISSGSVLTQKSGGNAQKKIPKTAKTFLESYDQPKPSDRSNTLPLSFFPERAGVYNSKILIVSKSNEYDIRAVDLTAVVNANDEQQTIEFKGPARTKIIQEIPIFNEGDTDWSLVVSAVGQSFVGPKSLNVARGAKEYYQITFNGPTVGIFEGTLSLKEPVSGEGFNYKLLGVAEEPLAEDCLTFKCKARKRETCKIPVSLVTAAAVPKVTVPVSKNAPLDAASLKKSKSNMQVQTDLPHVSGEATVEIIDGNGVYDMVVFSPVGGLMSGSITFTDPVSGNIIWYTVDIEVISPEAEGMMEVESMVRKAAALEISLDNPSSEEIIFDVEIDGHGLIGDLTYILPPGGANAVPYELLFSPLVVGHYVGSVRFMNSMVGEFWYKVVLDALPAPSIELPCIDCMLGDIKSIQISIENPLSQAVELTALMSDPEHFYTKPDVVAIGPYGESPVEIFFRASSLGEVKTCSVFFAHNSFGELAYEVSGQGLLPGLMPPVYIGAQMKEMGSHSISFKNPFAHPLPIDIVLMSEDQFNYNSPEVTEGNETDTFTLITKKTKGSVISPKSIFQIGLSFKPERLCQYKTFVQVRSTVGGRELLWCYPVIGIAEIGPSQRLPMVSTMCKTSYLREIEIPLEGLKAGDINADQGLTINDFMIETSVKEAKFKSLVDRSFRLQIIDIIELLDNSAADYALKCRMLFEPLKVFTATVELRVINSVIGHWKLNCEIESSDQSPDDVIQLTAGVGGTDKVSFRVSNRFLGYSPFQAYFSGKSSMQFTVSPSNGVLAPFGSEGTQFIVSFTPTEYGLMQKANLIIVTDDTQWTYELRGGFPEHKIDKDTIESKIATK